MRRILPASATLILVLSLCFKAWGGSGKLDQEVADLRRIQETNSRILAETVQNINSLRQELQLLKGSLEENRHFFEEESKKNEKVLRDFDFRLTGIEERLSLYGTQLEEFLAKSGKSGSDENLLYRQALTEINLQNYKLAIVKFDEFIKKFPKSSLVDNAQYWKGEALYASKQYPQAILEFQQVLKKYPKSDKVPAAILKQGYSFYESQNYLDAKAFLQKVVSSYPATEEAAQAKERIEKINQLLAKASTPPQSPVSRDPGGTSPGRDAR